MPEPVSTPSERVTVPRELLLALVDDDTCWFDHHGGCQAHGYLSLEPGETCPQAELKEALLAPAASAADVLKLAARRFYVAARLLDPDAVQTEYLDQLSEAFEQARPTSRLELVAKLLMASVSAPSGDSESPEDYRTAAGEWASEVIARRVRQDASPSEPGPARVFVGEQFEGGRSVVCGEKLPRDRICVWSLDAEGCCPEHGPRALPSEG